MPTWAWKACHSEFPGCVLLSCKGRIRDFYILGLSKALNSQVSIKLLSIFKHRNIFQYQFQSPWSWYPLYTIPLIMRAEHFAVVNGFHPCETGKCSHSFDSLRMAHVIDLEAFPEPHREAGMKPRSELMLLEFNPHLYLVTPLCSWKEPEGEKSVA